MDTKRFDQFTQFVGDGVTRRTVVRLLSGGALAGVVGQLGLTFSDAKGKSKKKHKAHRCGGAFPITCSPTPDNPAEICFPNGSVCCSSENGGGACPNGAPCCPPERGLSHRILCRSGNPVLLCRCRGWLLSQFAPTCCPPTPQDPLGLCVPSGTQCCGGARVGALA